MKVYVLYESLYGELLQESGNSTELLGVYKDIQDAKDYAKKLMYCDLKDGYVLDCEHTEEIGEKGGYYRLFWNNQENWNCYFEIIIEEKDLI